MSVFPWALWDITAYCWTWGGSLEPPICCGRIRKKCEWPGDHCLQSASGVGLPCETEPLTRGVFCSPQIDRLRAELNCRTPSSCQRIGQCENTPPTSAVRSGVSAEQRNRVFLSFSNGWLSGSLPDAVWLYTRTTCRSLSQRCIWNCVWFGGL